MKSGKPSSWKIEGSAITVVAAAGDVKTKQGFGDCKLHIEWQHLPGFQAKGREGDTGDFWVLSFSTVTVNDNTNRPGNYACMVKKADDEKPYGQWNIVEVISYKGACIYIINEVTENESKNASTTKGGILLQMEYSEIYYRDRSIRQL